MHQVVGPVVSTRNRMRMVCADQTTSNISSNKKVIRRGRRNAIQRLCVAQLMEQRVMLSTVQPANPTPDLQPYQPVGWSSKIVVSNVPNTNIDTPLSTHDTIYIDFA